MTFDAGTLLILPFTQTIMRPISIISASRIWRQGPSSEGFVCASCKTRAFSSTPRRASPSPPPAPPSAGLVALSSRRLISVSGPDAPKFLQGVITQNIFAAPTTTTSTSSGGGSAKVRQHGFYSAILTASGRVLYDVFIYPDHRRMDAASEGESFLVEVDADQAARLEKHFKRYKLRAKFDVRLLPPGEVTVWHGWPDQNVDGKDFLQLDQPPMSLLTDPRAPGLGYRMLTMGEKEPVVDLPRIGAGSGNAGGGGGGGEEDEGEAAYRVRRYLFGVPEGQQELLREKALPLEGNLDVMGGVDFRKGCYVGQELTIRTKHRGVVRKRVLPVMLYGGQGGNGGPPTTLEYQPGLIDGGGVDAADIPTDTSIGRVGKKGRSAGKWLRGVGNIGLALSRLEIMTDVVLPGETAAASYNPADEFVMETPPGEDGTGGAQVKVKAFVPAWLQRELDGQQHG